MDKWKLDYDVEEMEERLTKSRIYKLACIQLKREGNLERIKLQETIIYPINVEEVVLKGLEILKKADQYRIKI